MKAVKLVAVIFYRCGSDDPRYYHLDERFLLRSVDNLHSLGFDRIIVKDDGSTKRPPEMNHVETRRNNPREGINQGIARSAPWVRDDEVYWRIDPHNIHTEATVALTRRLIDGGVKAIMHGIVPYRVRRGPWAGFSSTMTGPVGTDHTNVSWAATGAVVKDYAVDYLSTLRPEDMSYPDVHFELWATRKYKKLGQFIAVEVPDVHDDDLDFWGEMESSYNNGKKAGQTAPTGLPPMQKQLIEQLRSWSLTEVWNAAKNTLWLLGAAESRFKLKPEMTYYDVLFLNEVPRPEHLYRWPYMLKADEFTVGSVLDLGCGNGLFLLYAWSMRPHVHWYGKGEYYDHDGEVHSCIMGFPFAHGIDCSSVAIGHARAAEQRTAKTLMFEVGDIMGFTKEEYADTVTILEVLEHLPTRERRILVENAYRVCRHRVVATVPRTPVTEPNHQIAAFREDQLRELFKPFPRVFISMADSLRWLVVGIKRQAEADENWEVYK